MKHSFKSVLVMIAELSVRSGKREEFVDYIVANLEFSRSYPGNIEFDILIDEANPDKVIFYEVWESKEAQQAYMASRVQAGDLTTLLAFLKMEPKFSAYQCVAA